MIKYILYFLALIPYYLIAQVNVEFSHEAGFYDEPFFLKIKCDKKASISYTTSDSNKSYSFIDSLKIDKNIAIVFRLHEADDNIEFSPKSYFINFNTEFNVVSLTLSKLDLFDSIRGIYVDGINWRFDSLYKIKKNANYTKKWERHVYVEMFDSQGDVILDQNAGIRIFGGLTRFYPEKSLRIIARKRYGQSRFDANIFGVGVKDYKQFILRHSGNDYKQTRFKDVLSTELASEVGLDIQKFVPAHLFVNSEYWGVYNIREKINKYYIDNNHQTGVDDLNIIRGYNYVDEGDFSSFSSLLDFAENNNFKSDSVFIELCSIIDIDQFVNYWIYQIYFANIDSRGNARFWNSDSLGIKYRPILYDVDLGWFMCDSNLLKDFTSSVKTKWYNPPWRTLLLRKSLENKKFRNRFINQISYLMNTHLNSENIVQKINEFSDRYNEEMVYHFNNRKRFESYQGSIRQWVRSIDKMKQFALKRDSILLTHLAEKFHLTKPYFLEIEINNFNNGSVLLNNNKLQNKRLFGKFFNDIFIPFDVSSNQGYSSFVYETDSLYSVDSLVKKKKIFFKSNIISNKVLSFNEIEYENQYVEIFNHSDTDVVMKDWQLYGANGMDIIDSLVIPKNRFCVLHSHSILDKMDSIIYKKINFNIIRNDKLWLYSADGRLVDSVCFEYNNAYKSYSRTNPFDTTFTSWEHSFFSSIGYHNKSYIEREMMNDIIRNERIFIYILLVCFVSLGLLVPKFLKIFPKEVRT
jgi:hypothetical protein